MSHWAGCHPEGTPCAELLGKLAAGPVLAPWALPRWPREAPRAGGPAGRQELVPACDSWPARPAQDLARADGALSPGPGLWRAGPLDAPRSLGGAVPLKCGSAFYSPRDRGQ